MMTPLPITCHTCVSALGRGLAATLDALREERGGLGPCTVSGATVQTWTGTVSGLDAVRLPPDLARYDCRNNRLALLALQTDGFAEAVAGAVRRWGAERIGVVLGTSTSGIAAAEEAYMRREADGAMPADFDFHGSHELVSLPDFVARALGVTGPSFTISTACSSSAKSFVDGAQLIAAGVCDAVVVGGVDTLCLTSLQGFNSLQLLSTNPCRPNDAARDGISIGEAGGFALLEREAEGSFPRLLGYGESSDAHHMSHPHPEGLGAREAMRAALERAGLTAADIDYVNMHGTGTPVNDRVEALAIAAELGRDVPCSSTKGWTGHTLGAAGIVEAVVALLALEHGLLPGNLGATELDPGCEAAVRLHTEARPLRTVMSNNFGFGGSNCTLVFGGAAA